MDLDTIGLPCPLAIYYWQSTAMGNILDTKKRELAGFWAEQDPKGLRKPLGSFD
jgi:hypothetical protein